MGNLSDRLKLLGAAVADVSDRAATLSATDDDPDALSRARTAFVVGSMALSRRRSPWLPALAAAASIALAGAGWGRYHASVPAPISYSVGTTGVPGFVGDWVAAGADVPLETRFSDGSELALSPGARMRVATTNPAGAEVLVERGSIHAAVAHPQGAGTARWALRAGPFEVRVTGTTFDAAWDPMAETFVLTMIEGRVVVSGPGIPPDRTVVGGERLVASVRDARMALVTMGDPQGVPQTPPDQAGTVAAACPEAPSVAACPEGQPVTAPPARPEGRPVIAPPARPELQPVATTAALPETLAPAIPAWKDLVAKGKYRDAFAAAEAAGFSGEIERAPAGDLLMLADAARFAGSPGRAREALLAARRRFGVRGQSAFLLGKIAADQQGSPGDAVSWFETYLREEPGGPLAEQALGRIVDLARRASPDAARKAAARYLARYPDGAYSLLALSLAAARPKAVPDLPADRPRPVRDPAAVHDPEDVP